MRGRGLGRLTLSQATLASVGAQVLSAVATIAATPYLISTLGLETYGILIAVAVLTGQLGALQLGIPSAAVRLVAESRGRSDPRQQAAILRAVLLLGFCAAAFVAVVFSLIAPWVWSNGFRGSPAVLGQALAAVPAAAVLAAAQPVLGVSHAVLLGEERFGLVSLMRAVQGVVRVGVVVWVAALGGGLAALLWAQAATDVAATLLAGLSARAGAESPVTPTQVRHAARQLVGLGVPFAAADFLSALLVDAEKLAIGLAKSVADFAYYTVPFNAAMRLTVLSVALSSVLVPRISSVAATGDVNAAAALAHRATRLIIITMAAVLAPLIAVVPELLALWVGSDFALHAGFSTRLILVALFANTAANAAHAAIRARGRPTTLPVLYACELVVHLVVVYFAVRAWGITGAAVAWGLRATLDAAAQRMLAVRALGTSIGPWSEFLVPLVALATLAAGCELLGSEASLWLRLPAGLFLGGTIAAWLSSADDWKLLNRTLRPWTHRINVPTQEAG